MTVYEICPDIQNHRIFRHASADAVNQYLCGENLELCRFPPKEKIYTPASKTRSVGILLSGRAQICPDNGGERSLMKTMKVGELFGIANLYAAEEPFPSVIRAKESCTVLFINGNAFREWLENDSAARLGYLELLSRKIVYLNRKIAALTAGNVEKKLAFLLLENEVGGVFQPDCSMTALADMLGVGRASLYRATDSLQSAGMLCRTQKNMWITDREKLMKFLSLSPDPDQK